MIMNSEELANKVRVHAIKMTHNAQASHIGSILSIVDILAVLYCDIMKINPKQPKDDSRDRFILSKGHAGVALYATLAEVGYFPVDLLNTYYQNGSNLSGHISHKNVAGVEFSTGSLGHGVCVASGIALAGKLDNKKYHVYAIVGDGECEEGSIWEMALFASHNKLDNFTIIVDHNKIQAMGNCNTEIGLRDLEQKWKSFGFRVIECDGHSHIALREALLTKELGKPLCIIAHTIKGKGVSFMENNLIWHYRDPQGEAYEDALKELKGE